MSTTVRSSQDPASELTATIVDRVAAREDVGPLELPPLYESVDPDALAALFSVAENDVDHVTFSYCSYEVTVEGPEDVHLTRLDDR